MKTSVRSGLIFMAAIASCLAGCASHGADDYEKSREIISRHHILFEVPPSAIPSTVSVDAPLLGNGFTAVAISGDPARQVLRVARNDFWRLKSMHGHGYPAPLGKIIIDIPALEGASYLVDQSLYDARTRSVFTKGGMTVKYDTYVAAGDDVMIVEITAEGGDVEGTLSLALPEPGAEIIVPEGAPYLFPTVDSTGVTAEGVLFLSRAFREGVDIPTEGVIAARIMDGGPDGKFTVSRDKPVRMAFAFSSGFKSDEPLRAVIRTAGETASAKGIARVERRHAEWWRDFWAESYVTIPDEAIEKQYYLSNYTLASCSRDMDFPPSIFGSWITAELPGWSGDYHLNYNHLAPYYGLYSSNHIAQAEPHISPLLAFIPRGEYYSNRIAGIDGGLLFPVGIGPLGIETTRVIGEGHSDWIINSSEDEGMFWGQKSNSAYCMVNVAAQFYTTYDCRFAQKAYPLVKGVATFWENYLQRDSTGRYVVLNDAIHEGTYGTKNGILSLGLVRMVMQTALDMSRFLDLDSRRRPLWEDILDNIADFPLQERDGKTVFRYSEKGPAWWGDNTLGIQHIYPAGQIGPDSDPVLLGIARNTIEVMARWSDFNGTNSFFPSAVRVGHDPRTILDHLHAYSLNTYPNGFQRGNPHGIENLSTVPNTINQMYCTGHQGVVRIFPVWPRDTDVSFRNLRVEGAFLVSASISGGEPGPVTIFSEKGRPCTLVNPWAAGGISVENGRSSRQSLSGERITFETEPGEIYVIRPAL